MSDTATPAVVATPAAPPPPPVVAPVVIPAVTELADKFASEYTPKDRISSMQADKAEFAALMAAADQAIDAMNVGTEPAAAVAPVAPATQAPAVATEAAAPVAEAPKPKTLDDAPATTEAPKTLGEPAPIRPLSLRERQLEKQTREPLEQRLAKLQADNEAVQREHKSFQENLQQLYRTGRVDEAARMAFGVGLTDLQRADLQARGAIQQQQKPENPETAELRARLERFEQSQAQQAKAQAEAQHRAALQRQEEADLRDVVTEMEASGYEDVKRIAKVNGVAKMVAASIKANPHLETEHHWRAAKQRITTIADHLIEQIYPHLVSQLKGGAPPVPQQTGVSPAQAGVSPAARPVAQSGVMPVQPSAPAAPIALPQDNSADAGQRKFSSDKEEWDALLASMGVQR